MSWNGSIRRKKMDCVFPSNLPTWKATGKVSGLKGFLLSESFQHLTVLGYIGNTFASFSYAVIFMSEADSLTIILIMSCSSSKSCTNIKELSGRLGRKSQLNTAASKLIFLNICIYKRHVIKTGRGEFCSCYRVQLSVKPFLYLGLRQCLSIIPQIDSKVPLL